jgi:F-type H+-transporting ATPase subunit gamma
MAGGLKEVRERIKSVISTQQITKAMKMVSAAKLRRAQTAIVQARPYANKLNGMLSNIMNNLDGDSGTSFGKAREVKKALIVVVTSNRGLCGAFNTNVNKEAALLLNGRYQALRAQGGVTMLFVGRKGYDFFRRRYTDVNFIADHIGLYEKASYENSSALAQTLMQQFAAGEYDAIDLVFGQFKNAATQEATVQKWLPVPKVEKVVGASTKKADYIFDPNKQELLESLIPSILQLTFHKTLLDTTASEHGARMTAMDKATENAEDILKGLRIGYNKARQESITKELSEIVGGSIALEG